MGTFPSALRPSGDENEGHDNRSDDGSEGSEDLGDLPTWTEDFNLAQEWQHVLRALQVDSHPPTSHTNEAPPKDLLFRQLRQRELFGVPKRQLRWESTIPPNDRKVYADVKSRIDDVIMYCDGPNRTPETVIEAMRKINEHLSAAESKHAEYCKLLLVDLGFQRYLQFLLINPDAKNLPFEVRMYAVKDGERNMIRKFALECLRQLTLKDTTLLSALASNNQELILCLFHLLESHHHIEVASSLLQDILAVLPTIIDASTIPNLVTLINKANPKDFASLFRVVPFLIYELDDPISMDTIKRFPPSSMASKKAKFSQKAHMIERNQAFLISRSLIVERLIEVLNLIASKSIPRIPRRLLRIFQGQSNDLSEVLSEIPQASLESIIQGYMNMNQHIDCLFVLSNLLAGKRAADVQIKCVKLQIIPKLQKILPKLNWDPEPHDTSHGPTQLHGPGCDCNPESALNTQFLRVVHSLCDRDLTHGLTRRLMFTREELRRMDVKPDSDHDRCGSSGLFGLLPGVVNILKRQNQDSPYRFWLSSCVEAFLRGSPPKYQDSLNSNGLMNHAIESVLKNGGLGGEGLQTGYDLISELVKFNPRAMCAFSESFNEKEFERFIEMTVENLVDSNVFLRAVILTEEWMSSNTQPGPEMREGINCKISRFYRENRMRLLYNLMNAISIDKLSQENICCLNTALIIIIMSIRRQEGRKILEAIHQLDYVSRVPGRSLQNFLELMLFWNKYYSCQFRDGISLEVSSRISIQEWQRSRRFVVASIRSILQDDVF